MAREVTGKPKRTTDEQVARSFWDLPTLDELAAEQGIEPVERLEDLVSGFWPEDESVDDFLAAIESRG